MLGARRRDPSHTTRTPLKQHQPRSRLPSSLLRRFDNVAGEIGFVGGFVDEVADQVDGAELGIGHVEAGRVRQEVEHGAMFNCPTDDIVSPP